jgi:hypothetical protein
MAKRQQRFQGKDDLPRRAAMSVPTSPMRLGGFHWTWWGSMLLSVTAGVLVWFITKKLDGPKGTAP